VFPVYTRVSVGILKIKRRRMKLRKGESSGVRVCKKTREIFPAPREDGVRCEKVNRRLFNVEDA
jgi:hypothetical protein